MKRKTIILSVCLSIALCLSILLGTIIDTPTKKSASRDNGNVYFCGGRMRSIY